MLAKISTIVLLAANAAALASANSPVNGAQALEARHNWDNKGPSQGHGPSKAYHPSGGHGGPAPTNGGKGPHGGKGHHSKPGKGGNPKGPENEDGHPAPWGPAPGVMQPGPSKSWGPSQSHHHPHHPHHPSKSHGGDSTPTGPGPNGPDHPTDKPHHGGHNKGHHHGGHNGGHHGGHHGSSHSRSHGASKTWHPRPTQPKGHETKPHGGRPTQPKGPSMISPPGGYEHPTEPHGSRPTQPKGETSTHHGPSKQWPSASARARLPHEAGDMYALYGHAAAVVCGLSAQMPGAEITACPLVGGVGWDCLNLASTLESCGGCQSLGEGEDCTAIPGAQQVGCVHGKCLIATCEEGYYLDGDHGCVKN